MSVIPQDRPKRVTYATAGPDRFAFVEGIKQTKPWFWVVVALLAALGIVALVLAISAGNEGVDQQQIAHEATEQVKEEVAGLNEAVETANEFQEESSELAEENTKQINQQVAKAVEGGEEELHKLRRRVAALEAENGLQAEETKALEQQTKSLQQEGRATAAGQKELAAEVKALTAQVEELEEELAQLEP
jgi:chromosome segregation ATPase